MRRQRPSMSIDATLALVLRCAVLYTRKVVGEGCLDSASRFIQQSGARWLGYTCICPCCKSCIRFVVADRSGCHCGIALPHQVPRHGRFQSVCPASWFRHVAGCNLLGYSFGLAQLVCWCGWSNINTTVAWLSVTLRGVAGKPQQLHVLSSGCFGGCQSPCGALRVVSRPVGRWYGVGLVVVSRLVGRCGQTTAVACFIFWMFWCPTTGVHMRSWPFGLALFSQLN